MILVKYISIMYSKLVPKFDRLAYESLEFFEVILTFFFY